jgi:hypothetical protein
MLRSRAITEVARMGATDALYGVIYDPRGTGADLTPEGNVTVAQMPAETGKPPSIQDAIAEREAVAAAWEPQAEPTRPGEHGYDAASEPRTEAQSRKLHALFREHGFDRINALIRCAEITGRTIDSTKDLTVLEASHVIDVLSGPVPERDIVDAEVVA